jgi:hypothetical protein
MNNPNEKVSKPDVGFVSVLALSIPPCRLPCRTGSDAWRYKHTRCTLPVVLASVLAFANCHKWLAFWLLLAGLYRFSYTEVTEGSAGQVPGAEVALDSKAASGSKVCIYRHPLLLR